MGETPEKHPILTRPKLRKVPLPLVMLKCFLCSKVLDKKTNDFHGVGIDGVIFFACHDHIGLATQMIEYTKTYLERLNKSATEQEIKTE